MANQSVSLFILQLSVVHIAPTRGVVAGLNLTWWLITYRGSLSTHAIWSSIPLLTRPGYSNYIGQDTVLKGRGKKQNLHG